MQKLRVIFQDEYLVAVDKPAGLMVHPPEDAAVRRFTGNSPTVIRLLREQLGKYVYPVHRLDGATSGVLVLAFSSAVAGKLQESFKTKMIQKTYFALVRGFTEDEGRIDSALTIDDKGSMEQEALTVYQTAFRFELAIPGEKHPTSRFSLVQIEPKTGRYHQIRRHFKRISHPLIGDTLHGDGKQNRIWRQLTGDSLLYLKAYSLSFPHPVSNENTWLHSRWSGAWQKIFDQAGFCPIAPRGIQ